jgi:cholesterol oxidase
MAFDFDVLIIGSGFGATVLALDQAAKGKTIMILERGVWWLTPELSVENPMAPFLKSHAASQPVQYWPRPDHRRGLVDFMAMVKANGVLGGLQDFANGVADFFTGKKRPQPLYRYNTFPEADIVTASGVGGGSLIYSNVTLEPFFDAGGYPVMNGWTPTAKLNPAHYAAGLNWMTTKRGAPNQVVTKYPQAVPGNNWATLQPSDARLMGRARFLRDASTSATLDPVIKSQIAEPWQPLKLQVAEADPNTQASNHNYCERQGRCFLGCLPGARHTLNKSLLKGLTPLLNNNTVVIRPLANVDFIEPLAGGGFKVHYEALEDGSKFHPTAKTVIVAAGSLGTSELLLRSRDKTNGQLTLSDKLGTQFSTNGDFSGFITIDQDKLQYPIYTTRGPINMSHVTFRDGNVLVNVEDAGIPPMFASLVERTLDMISKGGGADVIDMMGLLWDNAELPDPSDPNLFATEAEMLMNTCWFNCMGTDGATGKFELDHGHLTLSFSDKLSDHATFKKAETIMREMAKAMNGTFRPFPLWEGLEPFVSRKLVVTHPLGGCPIGGSSSDGVVNASGQVYNTKTGAQTVHDGLFVADGSMVPGPLAVNPTLTIVSMALRVAAAIP